MDLQETTLKQSYAYQGKIINTRVDQVRLPDGRTSLREVVEHHGGVCIAALTDAGELLFVRQFRYPYQQVLLEIPAGKLEPGEDPLECGKRELKEETGATAARYQSLGQLYPSPGYCAEIIHMYLAQELSYGQQALDEGEFLTVEKIPLDKAVQMVLSGEIKDAKTQAAVLKVRMLTEK